MATWEGKPTLASVLKGYTPPTESPLADPIIEHFKSVPKKFAENQAKQMELLSQAFPGDTYESMMTQGDPKAMAELAMQTPFNAMIAYHGTPHNILGKFDISKVGTGEGAQSYGHGMYFAENPAVAKQYQAALSNTKYKIGERELKGNEAWAAQFLHDFQDDALPKRVDVNTAIKKAKETLNPGETQTEIVNKIKELEKAGLTVENGNLYKVDIPDADIPKMLDYDSPILEQPELYEIVRSNIKDPDILKTFEHNAKSGITGANVYQNYLGGKTPAEKSANALKMGIKGIRYLDEGSRIAPKYTGDMAFIHAGNSFKEHGYSLENAFKGMKEAYKNAREKELKDALGEVYGVKPNQTSNFVVFDPSEVKILEKNSKPVSRKELIEEQVNKLK